MLWSIFFLFFVLIPFSRQKLRSLLLHGNKSHQLETSAQCVEWSQFLVDYFLAVWATYAGFYVIKRFSQWLPIRYSSKLMTLWVTAKRLLPCGQWCAFQREFPPFQRRQSFNSSETLRIYTVFGKSNPLNNVR